MTNNYKFTTYRNNKSGEIVIESKSEQSAINKIQKMSTIDLKENIDKKKIAEVNIEEDLTIFYQGKLIRKL